MGKGYLAGRDWEGRRGNATVPLREGGAHTTLGGGLYAIMPWRRGGGHSCAVQPVVPARCGLGGGVHSGLPLMSLGSLLSMQGR